jgi:hypothetical protein
LIRFLPGQSAAAGIASLDDPLFQNITRHVEAVRAAHDKEHGAPPDAPYWRDHALAVVRVGAAPPGARPNMALEGRVVTVLWTQQLVRQDLSLPFAPESGSALAASKFTPQKDELYVVWLERRKDKPGSGATAAQSQPLAAYSQIIGYPPTQPSPLPPGIGHDWLIPSGPVPFFPSGCAAQRIKGLDDPLVKTIADKLAAARATTTQPATQPSAK